MIRRFWTWVALAVLVAAGVVYWTQRLADQRLARRLLASSPAASARDPALVRFAIRQARPLFATHCAPCHGTGMTGNPAVGAPNLTDSVWLYGNGSVFSIERTLLYGIRAGVGKTHNVTYMPAFGVRGVLDATQIGNVVQYLLQLNRRPYQADAAAEGRQVYNGKGNCADCHGADARGNSDYGSPDLTINVWNNGGDVQSLYHSLYFGRQRVMPAWLGPLTLEQIRALAVYVHAASHPAAGGRDPAATMD